MNIFIAGLAVSLATAAALVAAGLYDERHTKWTSPQ